MLPSRYFSLGTIFFFALAAVLVFASAAFAQNTGSPETQLTLGSPNTATADPNVPRPNTKPCIVPLFSNFEFADFSLKAYQYTPPADCPGPWAKIVFTADFNITAGRQFDRSAAVYLGHVNIYFGTTPEPSAGVARFWHVERDLTDYSALFNNPQSGQIELGNLVNSTYTGIIFGSGAVELYPVHDHGDRAPLTPDAVYPFPDADGGAAVLKTTTSQLSRAITFPPNVERAYFDVITESQSHDEFWYTCVPSDVTNELMNCGNTDFREAEISIDGQAAGLAPVYPWIYTGGIDPFLWRPIPGVQALNFVPYRVDLSPFAGVLSNGQAHTIAVSIFNANQYFRATGVLLTFLDHGSQQITGAVTENSLSPAPTPVVTEHLTTDASGVISGTVGVTSSRSFEISGFVNTAHGRVETEVKQIVDFSNQQQFTVSPVVYVQNITESTELHSKTTTRLDGFQFVRKDHFAFPLIVDFSENFASDGSFNQHTSIQQEFSRRTEGFDPRFSNSFSNVQNKVQTTDNLLFNASGGLTGHTGQASSEDYHSFDHGRDYRCSIASATGILTSAKGDCVK
ncbi:MAG TPA: peptide-N4-asparagine amidase [Candidatus Acidoferrum sp.]|nr:peptide-N4-asparagine amidase [Candidatus Acidoferrum sp.]